MKLTQNKADLLMAMQYRQISHTCYINGEKFEFNVYNRFSPTKTKELIDELIAYISFAHAEELDDFKFMDMVFGLILKHFTDVPLYTRITTPMSEVSSVDGVELIGNCAKVTNSLASILTDDGISVLNFLAEKIDSSEISKLETQIGDVVIALAKYTQYNRDTQKLLEELSNFVELHMKKVELSQAISEKIKDLKDGGERVFEKEVE